MSTKRPARKTAGKAFAYDLVDWTRFQPSPVVGCDEVGRGCLAGPVVAAAVVLNRPIQGVFYDSKSLSELRREELFELVKSEHSWAVGIASVQEIDRLNILQASLLAMRRAVEGLHLSKGHILVDGKFLIPGLPGLEQTALIQGDARAEPISAASIVAKVTRDRMMKRLAERFPHYAFEENKGYGTAQHRRVLAKMGPTPHHRRSFRGVVDQKDQGVEV